MSAGYTMLTIGALALLMVVVINADRLIVNADVQPAKSKSYHIAVALGEEMFGEIRTKRFDQNSSDSLIITSTQKYYLTPVTFLGPDAGSDIVFALPDSGQFRSAASYNDIDDYHRYSRMVNTPEFSGFRVSVEVYYVSETDYVTRSGSQTFLKKIVVSVERQPDIQPISFSTIQSY